MRNGGSKALTACGCSPSTARARALPGGCWTHADAQAMPSGVPSAFCAAPVPDQLEDPDWEKTALDLLPFWHMVLGKLLVSGRFVEGAVL